MKWKAEARIETSDFWYDLTDGGYIKPSELLENKEDIERVENAIKVIQEFEQSAWDNDIFIEL